MLVRSTLLILASFTISVCAQANVLDIQSIKTQGGLDIWLVEDKSVPVVAMHFAFASGAATDPHEKQGLSQLLSNMLDEGAGKMDATIFQKSLRDNAIDMSFASGRDAFYGSFRTLKSNLPLASTLMQTALSAPHFEAEALARMQAANITRLKSSLSNPRWLAQRLMNEAMYEGHPYAANSGGTLDNLPSLSAVDLRTARARHFAKERLYIGIAGDIAANQAAELADNIFGRLPQKAAVPALQKAAFPAQTKHLHYTMPMPQTQLQMAWPSIGRDDADYYAAQMLAYIFGGGGFASRLMQTLREESGLTYGAYAYNLDLKQANRMLLDSSMLPENIAPALLAINGITHTLMNEDVDAETLQYAKDYLTGSLPLQFTSTADIASALVSLQLDSLPPQAFDDYKEAINALTSADLKRVARRIFENPPLIVTVGAPPNDLDFEQVQTIPNTQSPTKP